MCRLKPLLIAALIFLAFTSSIALAGEVKAFVPEKPWEVTINLNDFEPWDLLQPKTILGGSTKDDITISILVEKTKSGTRATEIRELYGQRSLKGFGQPETANQLDVDGVAVLLFKLTKQNIPDFNEPEEKQAAQKLFEEFYKNRWSYHGYIVKEDIAFDIHLSADMSKHTKKQMLDIIKSFKIKPSTELQELKKLYEQLYKELNKDLDIDIQIKERLNLASDFISKYPTNPEVQVFLGDHHLEMNQLEQAKNYYLKALDNHKIQPFINPTTLWTCYDGLGMCYGMSGKYEQCKPYFELGYKLANDMEESHFVASSAYNLACLYAEANDVQNSIKYLTEAVELNPESKEEAKQDPSFTNIKENQQFKDLIYK